MAGGALAEIRRNDLPKDQGSSPSSAIGPVLANLCLHYAMDEWMRRKYPQCPFERYADDSVIHCRTEAEATKVKEALAERLKVCGLEMNAEKTKIVYCKDSNREGAYLNIGFDFLGYTFKPRMAKNSIRGVWFTNWLPTASNKSLTSMRRKMKEWAMLKTAGCQVEDIAKEINPVRKAWIGYYGKFYKAKLMKFMNEINLRIVKWARTKYLKVRPGIIKGLQWLKSICQKQPKLFAHWTIGAVPTVG